MEYQFEKLVVYQGAMDLTESIYRETKDFPKEEMFGITSQIRRAAMSVALNIAEGKGRYHTKVFVQFLYQARGSLYETITLLKMIQRLGYMKDGKAEDLLKKTELISAQLSNLINGIS